MIQLLDIAEVIGTVAFAFSGFLVAGSVGLDLLGIFIAAFLTALGGGVIRDIIADKALFAFTNNIAAVLVITVVIFGIFFKLHRYSEIEKNRLFLFADTLGLVAFAISGAVTGCEAHFNFFGVVLLALVTATGGGVLRDILINRVPFILTHEFYGTVTLVVGIAIYLLDRFATLGFVQITLIFVGGVILRLVAHRYGWHLPVLHRK